MPNEPTIRGFNHVGVGVPAIEPAVAWYCDILGCRLIAGPREISRETGSLAQAQDVLGPTFLKMWQAHLVTPDGVGIELFQLVDPPHERRHDLIEFWKNGIFHFCVTAPDIEALARRIAETGGRHLSQIWCERPPSRDYRMVYCADPFGTVIEIYTHEYRVMQGPM